MKILKSVPLLLLTVLLLLSTSTGAFAASTTELTPSIQAAFDLTAATAESSARVKLTTLYNDLSTLKLQYDHREEQIRILHYNNEQALIVVRQQIKGIDLEAVTRLETTVKSCKQRYQPLFDQYSALTKRISIAKGFKDKTLNAVLRAQGDAMKILVQLARQEISDKQNQLNAAKKTRTQKIAEARKTLSGIESPQITIKSNKSVITSLNKRISADWSDFKAAIRKQNLTLTTQSLSSLVSGYRQIATHKQKVIELEQKVSIVIANTKKQIS
ncbi:hypothetical protein [Paenibacillus sp.]|uniref:hypothetical protein n=1 Tax=Paenibacillus sp. TaxID=58172 RepID=UPI0028A5963A|nr:hypothetical protein [Paenibacillus sp.]